MELARTRACTAPLTNLLAIGGVLEDARFGVTVADENPTFRRKRNIGRTAECGERWSRQSTRVDLKQLCALRTELDNCGTARVDRPDIPLRVEPDRMRNLVQAFTKNSPAALLNLPRNARKTEAAADCARVSSNPGDQVLGSCLLEYPYSVGQTAPILVSVRRISDTDRSRWPDVSRWAMVGVFLRSCAEKHESGRDRVA